MSKFIPNSFMVANAFVDEAMNKISDASVKIYLLIIRKTRGWTKESDALSLRQLETLSKKSRPTVIKCLNELEKVGLIKKHHQSKYGNVYSPVDNYDIGELIKFPAQNRLVKTYTFLVKTFVLFKKQVVKNFYHFGYGEKIAQNTGEFHLNIGGKKTVLVKIFYHLETVDKFPKRSIFFTTTKAKWSNILTTGGKEFLPQVVKNFNPQSNTIKKHYQNKKSYWFDFENLRKQIESLGRSADVDVILKAAWFDAELNAFDEFNKNHDHSEEMKIYFLALWMIKARSRHESLNPQRRLEKQAESSNILRFSSVKQIYAFASKLAALPDVCDEFSVAGESYEKLASRIAKKLSDPNELQNWKHHLEKVGFKSSSKGGVA